LAGKYIYDYNELERGNMYVITMNQREEICMWLQWIRERKYVCDYNEWEGKYIYDYKGGNMSMSMIMMN